MTKTSTRWISILGGLFGVALVLGTAWSLLNLMARNSFDVRGTYTGVKSLLVESGGGEVHLMSAAANSPLVVRAHVTRGFKEPARSARRTSGGGLELRSSCSGLFSDNCTVNYDIEVPHGMRVVVESGGGGVVATNLSADALRLFAGDGDVSASDVAARSLELNSGGGDVSGTRIRATRITASSGGGDVSLDVERAARVLTAQSGGGSVVLVVPDVTYSFDANAGGGRVLAEGVQNDPRAPRTLRATAGAGSVIVSVH